LFRNNAMQKETENFNRENQPHYLMLLNDYNFEIMLAAFFLLFWTLGERSLWASEGRWAEIAREMLISGDFFHPTIGGHAYFDKPLLTYWVIAFFSKLTGRLDEFIVRLPSALAAVITLGCTVYLGRRLWSVQVGWLAGAFLLTSYGLLNHSHIASAETENLAAVMLAVTWYWTRRERPGFTTFLVFYLIMFIGSHMKGLTAFVVPVLIVLPDLLRQKRWRYLLWPSHWLALGIGVAVYLSPFIYETLTRPESYQESGLYFVFHENILRYFRPFDHKEPFYVYAYMLPLFTMPWLPIFIGALITSAASWKKLDKNTRWLIQAMLLIFAFFTLSGSRRGYYILPILPFCMLLAAVFLTEAREIVGEHRERGLRIQKLVLITIAISELVLIPIAVWILVNKMNWRLPDNLGWSFFVVGLITLLAGISTYKISAKFLPGHPLQTILVLIIMAGILQGGFFTWQYNILESRRTEKPFTMKVNAVAKSLPEDRVVFWRKYEETMIFYMKLDPPVKWLNDEHSLQEFLKSDQPGMIISQGRYVTDSIASMLPQQPAFAETCFRWESPDRQLKKMKAWLINPDVSQIAMENKGVNYAK
jgi:4-amino-4-deoxy-L-arabinose transferase-like glycosyltransferase